MTHTILHLLLYGMYHGRTMVWHMYYIIKYVPWYCQKCHLTIYYCKTSNEQIF